MDIIINVAKKDCIILCKNLPYIYKNLSPESIFIITSIDNFHIFPQSICRSFNVVLCNEDSLVPNLSFTEVKRIMNKYMPRMSHYGWYFQQFLKMGFALSKYAKQEYLVWDADTFPLNKLQFKENENYLFTAKTEYHVPYFNTMQKLLGLNKTQQYSFIAEHMIFNVDIMKELINNIDASSALGETWFEKIISTIDPKIHQGFSEFETYGTFFTSKYNNYKVRTLRTKRDGGKLFGRGVSTKDLKGMENLYDTISFELQDFPPFPKSLKCFSQIYYYYDRKFKEYLKRI